MEEMIEINLDENYGIKDKSKLEKAEKIITTRLSGWTDFAKQFEDEKRAELIFGESGEVVQMLSQVNGGEFLYDPQTVENAIDMILSVVQSASDGNKSKAKQTYLNFGDFRTRAVYLYSIINHLKVFDAIGSEVVSDYEKLKTVASDRDILLMLDNAIRNAKTQVKLERQNAQILQTAKVKI